MPCRAATCAISCAITPASSASVSAFRIRPEFTKKKPPGRAKAFTSSESSTLIVKGTLASELRTRFWPDAVDVLGDHRIVDDLGLALHFLGQLLAQADLFLQRVEVDALADIAVADLRPDLSSCPLLLGFSPRLSAASLFLVLVAAKPPAEETDCGQDCDRRLESTCHVGELLYSYTVRPILAHRVA